MKREWIENHFIENFAWKNYFLKHFPNYNPETWVEDVWSLFERNGYHYHIEMYKRINAVKYITLFTPSEDDIACMCDLATSSALQQLLIHVICDHVIDFNTFI